MPVAGTLLSADDTIKAAAIVMRLGDHDPTASEPSSVPASAPAAEVLLDQHFGQSLSGMRQGDVRRRGSDLYQPRPLVGANLRPERNGSRVERSGIRRTPKAPLTHGVEAGDWSGEGTPPRNGAVN